MNLNSATQAFFVLKVQTTNSKSLMSNYLPVFDNKTNVFWSLTYSL